MWNMIVSADRNWGIGLKNRLLVQIPQDMQRFREMTMGQIIVMGRKTLESLPSGQILKGRTNVILSASPSYSVQHGIVFSNLEELTAWLKEQDKKVYVIGGEEIYRQLLPYCGRAFITRIDYAYNADAHFPNLDQEADWELVSESEEQTYFDLLYTFQVYERKGQE